MPSPPITTTYTPDMKRRESQLDSTDMQACVGQALDQALHKESMITTQHSNLFWGVGGMAGGLDFGFLLLVRFYHAK